jgi:hypothetical protein
VIERQPDGTQQLDFKDWTPEMMALASCMFELPRRPGDTGPNTHEFGIDRLASLPRGREAIGMLYDHVSSIEWRPNEKEVVRIGQTLLTLKRELDQLHRDRRRHNGPTPIFGFRRGPRAMR